MHNYIIADEGSGEDIVIPIIVNESVRVIQNNSRTTFIIPVIISYESSYL